VNGRYLRGKTILLIDAHDNTRKELNSHLSTEGFEVLEATSGQEAKKLFVKHDPCFVLLENCLPDGRGTEICEWIRLQESNNVPIFLISERCADEDRIEGLKKGADDYLGKPFNLEELTLRIEIILRRTANRCSKISYRGLTLKPIKGIVKYEDYQLDLTRFEYKLLHLFMTHPDQILSREQIIDTIYNNNEKTINERTIDVHIRNLRAKIGQYTDYPFISSLRGLGYKFHTEGEK
jgi:DNA-binding response OmpR family regulator